MSALQTGGRTPEQASAIAGIAMAVFYSFANGRGRIAWGMISDRIGRKLSLIIMCLTTGRHHDPVLLDGQSPALLYLGATIIGFNFGGNFSLFPTMTGDLFGTKHVGDNYGWVFTAYGVGGIIGPIMAASLRDALQSWLAGFVIAGVACLVAAVIATRLRQPRLEGEPARDQPRCLTGDARYDTLRMLSHSGTLDARKHIVRTASGRRRIGGAFPCLAGHGHVRLRDAARHRRLCHEGDGRHASRK